jgi:hypothetical protein
VECLVRPIEVSRREYLELDLDQKRKSDKILHPEGAEPTESTPSSTGSLLLGKRIVPEASQDPQTTSRPQSGRFTSNMKRWEEVEIPERGLASRPSVEIKGHTSYLLFARKIDPPSSAIPASHSTKEAEPSEQI